MKTFNYLLFTSMIFLFSFQKSSEQLDFEFADKYCTSIEQQVNTIAAKYNLSASDVLPVVYPECSRFNSFSNAFESDILSFYYVRNGIEGADFSIGYFQMKPSFVEKLEREIAAKPLLSKQRSLFAYESTDPMMQRNERLDRLQSPNWQMEYLCAFVALMHERHSQEAIRLPKLNFTAAAYNYGFHKPSHEILDWSEVKAFPNGRSGTQNYAYGELALSFQQNHYGHE
ncbi:MAG: hypothetical protein ACO1O6_15055 [Bacteroidota bacterium]